MTGVALLGALLYSFASAVLLVLPIEPYLVGYAALSRPEHLALVALGVAAAHTAGKLLHFFLGAGILHRLRLGHRAELTETWAQRWEALIAFSGRHSWAMAALTFTSAAVSVPPFTPMPFVAASVEMRWWSFALFSTLGRWARFWAVMASPELLPDTVSVV